LSGMASGQETRCASLCAGSEGMILMREARECLRREVSRTRRVCSADTQAPGIQGPQGCLSSQNSKAEHIEVNRWTILMWSSLQSVETAQPGQDRRPQHQGWRCTHILRPCCMSRHRSSWRMRTCHRSPRTEYRHSGHIDRSAKQPEAAQAPSGLPGGTPRKRSPKAAPQQVLLYEHCPSCMRLS
jgi:hypothetical protein